jgi:hypothetical protein
MTLTLVNQNLHRKFHQIGVDSATITSLNEKLRCSHGYSARAPPGLGMTIWDADHVVRWTIDYSLGLAREPTSILPDIHVLEEGGSVTPGGPVEI